MTLYYGISSGFHDAALTVLQDDKILFASHSERYSRNKHDSNLDSKLLRYAINEYGQPDVVSYYEKPILKKLRQLYSGQYSQAFNLHDLSIKQVLDRQFPGLVQTKNVRFEHHLHHLSHAAGSFQTSPFDRAIVVVIDAIGEWDTITIWKADYNPVTLKARYKKLWGQRYPHSIGLFYSAMTQAVGLNPLDEEYITMGMAAYGAPNRTLRMIDTYIADVKNAEFRMNLHCGAQLENGIGRERNGDLVQTFSPVVSSSENDLDRINSINSELYDIAASAQSVVELLIDSVMRKAASFGYSKNLCYAGGVALNCLANSKVLPKYFDMNNVWIMPNPGDAGSSLGAAALSYGKRIDWAGSGAPYLGHNITEGSEDSYVNRVVARLLNYSMCGVASGRAEFGPRALGNRSLLADPRGVNIKSSVNAIKRRQMFRPFAPVILEEYASEYFDGFDSGIKSSPYMQMVMKCKRPDLFPAIVHVDGTSRVQTVGADNVKGTRIRAILEEWHRQTGCPMLLNTSLNIRGEPMVNDLVDARRFEDMYQVKVFS